MLTRAARGATQVRRDERGEILAATARLLSEMLSQNRLRPSEIVSVFFTVTEDIVSAFPAEAARSVGLGKASLLCAREIPVPGSLPRVIRVLMHFLTEISNDDVQHVYIGAAQALRDDLG